MLLARTLKPQFLRGLRTIIYLSSQLNRTYGSMNKPISQFSKQTKHVDSNIKSQHLGYKQKTEDENMKRNNIQKTQQIYNDNEERSLSKKSRNKHNKQFSFFFNLSENNKLDLITEYKQKEMIKQLSIISKEMLFVSQNQDVVWCAMQEAFISFLKPTTDPGRIRSLSQILYSLGKSKKATRNYETPMALLLPHASHQSFTQIAITISRMGGMSEQFAHIVEKLYWKRKQQFTPLQLGLLNYSLAKNGKKIDPNLIDNLNSYPLRGIALMLKSYDRSMLITPEILKKCVPAIIARKAETDFFDLKHLINVYTKNLYLDDANLLNYFQEQYKILARYINEQTLEDIWQHFPEAINSNKIPISFLQNIIKSFKTLQNMEKTFNDIQQNLKFGNQSSTIKVMKKKKKFLNI